jgi:uncharacterized protein YkwD
VRIVEDYRRFYKGKTLTLPGKRSIATKEGVKALDEVIGVLRMMRPIEPLLPSVGLCRAARDHVDNTGRAGTVGHVGTDKSNPNDRATRYGTGVVSENCGYGRETARDVVIQFLTDDGIADRGYRKTMLNPAFKQIGVSFGTHTKQRTMCSQVFSADFKDK